MADESKRIDQARDDRIRDMTKEPAKIRPKETDFDKILEKSRMAAPLASSSQTQSKTLTEDAIREAAKREDRQGEERKRDEDEDKGGKNFRQKGERSDHKVTDQKVIAKGRLKQDGGGSGGEDRRGGYGTSSGRRETSRVLTKSSAKSLPVDLQEKFAAKLARSAKGADGTDHAALSQQVINKIVQFVRIGLNRKGEKEIQLDLSEKIFRGLKLRVIARGGKVGVLFRTADSKGKAAFEKNTDAIRDALAKKGIEVDEILVS